MPDSDGFKLNVARFKFLGVLPQGPGPSTSGQGAPLAVRATDALKLARQGSLEQLGGAADE